MSEAMDWRQPRPCPEVTAAWMRRAIESSTLFIPSEIPQVFPVGNDLVWVRIEAISNHHNGSSACGFGAEYFAGSSRSAVTLVAVSATSLAGTPLKLRA